MDNEQKKAQVLKQLEKAEERKRKAADSAKALKKRLKELDKPETGLTRKQQNMIKIWHGVACLALIKEHENIKTLVHEYLEKNVKSDYQRRILGLAVAEKETPQKAPIVAKFSDVFKVAGAVIAPEDIALEVPYDDKDNAKAAGAKWNSISRTWNAPKGADLTKFEKWLSKDRDWAQWWSKRYI